jgi:hypothetical protein
MNIARCTSNHEVHAYLVLVYDQVEVKYSVLLFESMLL